MDHGHGSGQKAGVVKYDILTALAVFGLNGSAQEQVSMARLSVLITARYNWARDALSIGQKEMSEIWGIGERTVKREVKRWIQWGVMICTRPGVRGRVATYRLNIQQICELSRPYWDKVGPDFAERMQALTPRSGRVVQLDALRPTQRHSSLERLATWEEAKTILADRFPTQYAAWIAPLAANEDNDRLILGAKSAFTAQYVKTHFGREITDAVAAVWEREMQVIIRVVEEEQKEAGFKSTP